VPETVELRVKGKALTTWESVTVARSMESLSGSFGVVAFKPKEWPLAESDRIEVWADGEKLLTGNIDAVAVTLSPDEHRVEARGRDLTGDLVDSSIDSLPSEFRNISLVELVTEIVDGGYRIPVKSLLGSDVPRFDRFALQPGETVHDAVERACRMVGVLMSSDPDGRLILTRPSKERLSPGLVEGINVVEARGGYSVADRFNFYRVIGQHSGSDSFNGSAASGPQGSAEDPSIRPTRVKVILAETEVDAASCEQRARWEASMAAARASRVDVTVQGWRTDIAAAGVRWPLWQINRIVEVDLPSMRYAGDMLISSVRFDASDAVGLRTTLGLVRPDAYQAVPSIAADADPGAAVLQGAR